MRDVGQAIQETAGWAGRGRRIATAPRTPAVTASLLGLLALAEAIPRGIAAGRSPQSFLTLIVLCLLTTLPPAFLRPAAAAVAICAASVLSITLFQLLTAAGLAAQLIAAGRLGRRGPQALAVALSVPFLILALAGSALTGSALTGSAHAETRVVTILLAGLVPVAACAGIAWRARAEAAEHSAVREVIAGTIFENTARGERARISRELHDVVAHHISMIAVQAETARLTTPDMPASGAQRLLSIGDTARAALTEMRRLLGVLREDTETETAARQPQPGLRQLNELVDSARDATGAGTRLIVSGPPAALDPGVELAAYRIVQEALTNSRRHAPGAAVDVELRYDGDGLRLRIRDNGPGPPAAWLDGGSGPSAERPDGGLGLLGMRERALAVGGDLGTGAAPGGGFLVTASLPGKVEAAG
jgi:signal transduction histidine kinase